MPTKPANLPCQQLYGGKQINYRITPSLAPHEETTQFSVTFEPAVYTVLSPLASVQVKCIWAKVPAKTPAFICSGTTTGCEEKCTGALVVELAGEDAFVDEEPGAARA